MMICWCKSRPLMVRCVKRRLSSHTFANRSIEVREAGRSKKYSMSIEHKQTLRKERFIYICREREKERCTVMKGFGLQQQWVVFYLCSRLALFRLI